MQYDKELQVLKAAIKNAYQSVDKGDFRVLDKGAFDLVTEVDFNMEKSISKEILNHFPTDKILGEEFSGELIPSGRTWTIDPIDGTVNFAYQWHLFGVQCSLMVDGEIVVSVIYLPDFNEWFTAEKGKGAYLNGKPISVHKVAAESAIFAFGDFSRKLVNLATKQYEAIGKLYKKVLRVRMFGASSVDCSSVACGRIHGVVLPTKNIWDIAPGVLLVKEAGGVVKNLFGQDYKFGDEGVILTASEELLQTFLWALN